PAQILSRRRADAIPGALDVVGASRSVDEAGRRPDRMIAAEEESIARATRNRRHAAPVGFNPRRARIMEPSAVHRAPEGRIELEVGAPPLLAHRAEYALEVCLRLRMRSVDRVPRTAAPSAERHTIGSQRRAVGVANEPIGMLLEQMRV